MPKYVFVEMLEVKTNINRKARLDIWYERTGKGGVIKEGN